MNPKPFLLAVFSILLFFTGLSWEKAKAEIIPQDRRIDWSQVGVAGEIPNRTTLCATLSPSGGNDTSAIQSAVNNCPSGQVVKLNAGTFNINSGITVKSGVTLRGAGMGVTIIKNSTAVTFLVGFNNNPDWAFSQSPARDITSGNTKGSQTITTSAAHGWSVGDIILVDQLEDPSGNPPITSTGDEGACTWCSRNNGTRPAGQLDKVVGVPNSTTAVLELPLNKTYDKTPQAIKAVGVTSNAGVEDLTLDSTTACANDNYGIFSAMFSENSWILRVEMKPVCRIGLKMEVTYRNTVRGSTIHETLHHTSNGGYVLWMMTAGSANLVEDNIFYNGLVGIVYNGALSGNVFSYNYFTGMWNSDYPGRGWAGMDAHGAQPMMNLFEGNYLDGPTIGSDFTWGSAAYNTYFRNRQRTDTSPEAPINTLYGIQLGTDSWYMNLVGNVLGTTGYETVYQSSDIYDGRKGIYFLADSNVTNTLLRHGNWDSVNNSAVWDPSISDSNLPASLYLSSKPSWWGNLPWPAIGPDLNPVAGTIPAKERFLGKSNASPSPPKNLRMR